MPSVVAFPQLQTQLQAVRSQLSAATPGSNVPITLQGRTITLSADDANPVIALLDILQRSISAKILDLITQAKGQANAAGQLVGRYDSDRTLIQADLQPLADDLRSATAKVVQDLFSETIPEATLPSAAPIGTDAPSAWRRVDSVLIVFGAIITRLDRDLDTLAGLESSFFGELSETIGAMVAAEIAFAAANGALNNKPFELAAQRIADDAKAIASSDSNFNGKSLSFFYQGVVSDHDYITPRINNDSDPLEARRQWDYAANASQLAQAHIAQRNHETEIATTRIDQRYAIGDEVISRSKATLAAQVLEERILTQLSRMISGGFFARRRILRERIGRDMQELGMRMGGFGKGLALVFLFPNGSSWITMPNTVLGLRSWIGRLRQIDSFVGRQVAREYPLRLRLSIRNLVQHSAAEPPETSLHRIVGQQMTAIDLAAQLRAACGIGGRLRMRGAGVLLKSKESLKCLGSIYVQPPSSMAYGQLGSGGETLVSESLNSVRFDFVRTTDLPNADSTVGVGPWENISGVGKWSLRVEPNSELATAIMRSEITDIELLLEFALLPP